MKLYEILDINSLPNYYQSVHGIPGLKMINIVDINTLQHRARIKCYTHDRTIVYVEFKIDSNNSNILIACIKGSVVFVNRKTQKGIISFIEKNIEQLASVSTEEKSIKEVENEFISINKTRKKDPNSKIKYKLNWRNNC